MTRPCAGCFLLRIYALLCFPQKLLRFPDCLSFVCIRTLLDFSVLSRIGHVLTFLIRGEQIHLSNGSTRASVKKTARFRLSVSLPVAANLPVAALSFPAAVATGPVN